MYAHRSTAHSAPLPAAPRRKTELSNSAVHRPILAVDVVGSGRFSTGLQLHSRATLYRIVKDSYTAVGLPWDDNHHEDRGDGILLIPPAQVSAELLLGLFAAHLRAALRRHNQTASRDAQIRLRTAAHAGYVCLDGNGAARRHTVHLDRDGNYKTPQVVDEQVRLCSSPTTSPPPRKRSSNGTGAG